MAFLPLSSFFLPAKELGTPRTSEDAMQDRFGSGSRENSGFVDEYTDLGGDTRVGLIDEYERDPAYEGDELPPGWFSWRKLWRYTGPGFLMSIAYLDPGNLESTLQSGSQTGYALLWVLLWSVVVGFFFQMLAAKLGVVTGLHLAQHCRQEYAGPPRYALWIMTEIALIGSDVQEVIGSAIAISLLTHGFIPLWAGTLITAVDSFLILFIERCGVRHLEAVFGVLISSMAASFGVMYVWAGVPTGAVIKGLLIPQLPRSAIQMAVAIVGALIMPHNIYLHSALVHSRKVDVRYVARKKEALRYFSIESAAALFLALLINVACVSVFAVAFFGKPGAEGIGLENAGDFLGKAFGPAMRYIWAIGLLAAGQSSTMTGTYTGQFVMGGFLDLKISPWARISITRGVAVVPTLIIALAYRARQGTELDVLNQWLNVLQSVQLPFAIVPVLVFTSSPRIVGKVFANSPLMQMFCWTIGGAIMAINMSLIFDFTQQILPPSVLAWLGVGLLVVGYLAFVAYLTVSPSRPRGELGTRLSARSGDLLSATNGSAEGDGISSPLLPPQPAAVGAPVFVPVSSMKAPRSVFASRSST